MFPFIYFDYMSPVLPRQYQMRCNHGKGKSPRGSGQEPQSGKMRYRISPPITEQMGSCGFLIPWFSGSVRFLDYTR